MSTITSRWKWIYRQSILILVLVVVAIFPALPAQTFELAEQFVEESGLLDKIKHTIDYEAAAPVAGVTVLISDNGSVAFGDLASSPTTQLQLSADRGNPLAQYRLLQNAGIDLSDLDSYLQSLYENQTDQLQIP